LDLVDLAFEIFGIAILEIVVVDRMLRYTAVRLFDRLIIRRRQRIRQYRL
jgi:hypothetical protein